MVGKMDRRMERSVKVVKVPDSGLYQFSTDIGFKKNRKDLEFAVEKTKRSLAHVKTYFIDMRKGVQRYNQYSMNQEFTELNDEIYPNLAQVNKAMDVIGMSKRVSTTGALVLID